MTRRVLLIVVSVLALSLIAEPAYAAGTGGVSAGSVGAGSTAATGASAAAKAAAKRARRRAKRRLAKCLAAKHLQLIDGRAKAPFCAPPRVKAAIQAANQIRRKPYAWGGGHGSWRSRGYDCSGAVSYVLHGGGFLQTPKASGALAHWGMPGKGNWITVYANGNHAWMTIGNLRFDTSQTGPGTGPRWSKRMVSTRGYKVRHRINY
jgi:cell wall-associated NlpC family hydrolase